MKKIFQHIFVCLFSIYFLVMGLGFNLVSYCCATCHDKGVEYISLNTCCETAVQTESTCCLEEKETNACGSHAVASVDCTEQALAADCCSFSRLQTDWPVFSENNKLDFSDFQPFCFLLFSESFLDNNIFVKEFYFFPKTIPPDSGREILGRCSILLI